MSNAFQAKPRAGFTLTELLVAITVFAVVGIGITQFSISTSQILFTSQEKLDINQDIRNVTNEMATLARDANHFLIYRSYLTAPRTRVTVSGNETVALDLLPANDGSAGDFLVLYWSENDLPADRNSARSILRVAGYFRATSNSAALAPVQKFDSADWYPGYNGPPPNNQVPTADQRKPIEELIGILAPPSSTAWSNTTRYPVVLEIARGLADQRLFYNFRGRSIVVNGQIIHGTVAKEVTNTYNFSISPRG